MATLTGNSVDRDARLQQLYLERLEQQHSRRVAREIRRAMKDGAKAVRAGASPGYGKPEHVQRMRAVMNDLWVASTKVFAEHILGTEKAGRGPGHIKRARFQVPATIITDTVMRDWVRTYGIEKITNITDTTYRDIESIVTQGIQDGLSERQIGKLIDTVAPTKSASRAQTIARTETHAAAMASAQASAEATGIEMVREWVASGGERTREAHDAASGQVVGMNEPFIVDGEELMYPGDPNGSAGNVVNCRCAVVFVLP